MRRCLILMYFLSACAIQNDVPDFEYPAQSDPTGSTWPNLAVTEDLAAAGAATQIDAEARAREAARLAARARALRARAARLRAQ